VTDEGMPAPEIDTSVPHSARIWNYWLGGTDNYPVDRVVGDKYRATYPQIVDVARAGRYFLARAVRFLAGEAGVRQFIDVGTGLPVADNTHEVAQRVAPECRMVARSRRSKSTSRDSISCPRAWCRWRTGVPPPARFPRSRSTASPEWGASRSLRIASI